MPFKFFLKLGSFAGHRGTTFWINMKNPKMELHEALDLSHQLKKYKVLMSSLFQYTKVYWLMLCMAVLCVCKP